jgi:hypothetical protein
MSIHSEINKLLHIRRRYFCGGAVRHHCDCRIYASNKHGQRGAFCDCGLLHDLNSLDFALSDIIFEDFEKDYHLQETGKPVTELTPKTIEEKAACMKILEDVFGPTPVPELEEIKEQYNDMERVLSIVFSEDYPDCMKRLEVWYEKRLKENNYDKNASQSKTT